MSVNMFFVACFFFLGCRSLTEERETTRMAHARAIEYAENIDAEIMFCQNTNVGIVCDILTKPRVPVKIVCNTRICEIKW